MGHISRTTWGRRLLVSIDPRTSRGCVCDGSEGSIRASQDVTKTMTVHLKLYASKGERFEEIKAGLEEEFGYEPSNPEVVGVLMANYSSDVVQLTKSDTVRDGKRRKKAAPSQNNK